MSLINKMLQELDRRHAMGSPDADAMTQHIEPVTAGRRRRDLFWLILGLELAVALGWLAWTSYQLRPRSVVTELALRTASGIKRATQAVRPPAPAPVQATAPQPAAVQAPAPAAQPVPVASAAPAQTSVPAPQPTIDALKLAQSIERPVSARHPRVAPKSPDRTKAKAKAPNPSPAAADTQPQVHKRLHPPAPGEQAQAEFRRAMHLLSQGRVSEAEQTLTGVLSIDPSQAPARQALISLLVDQRRLNEAQRLLQEGLALDPAKVQFATVLARIYVEREDYDKALEVLRGCKGDVSRDPGYNTLLGAVLQHMARPGEAADAYRVALRAAPQTGTAWIGLGLSLAAQDHRPEAAEAFRRAVATGSLSREARDYAERQLRRLQ